MIREHISGGKPTIRAVNITNDAGPLDGIEDSGIWIAWCIINGSLALLCQVYVFKVLKAHTQLTRAFKVDFCNISLAYAFLGNISVILASIDPMGYFNIIVSTASTMYYISHFGLTIASFCSCLFFWQEAVVQVGHAMNMKMVTPNVKVRIVFMVVMTLILVGSNFLMLAMYNGEFPWDIINGLLSGYMLELLAIVGYMLWVRYHHL